VAYTGASAQSGRAKQIVVPLKNGGFVAFKTETAVAGPAGLVPAPPDASLLATPYVLVDDNDVMHRTLVDYRGDLVFGYDLVAEPLAETRQWRVSVRPLNPRYLQSADSSAPGGPSKAGARAPQQFSDSQVIPDGGTFALDLLVNAQTGVKIVDIVKVSFDESRLREPPEKTAPPKDFTLANVQLQVRNYRLLVNRELVASGTPTSVAEGALIWFYLPERGRFIFSLVPHDDFGFQKVGTIENNKISFTWGNDGYEWFSATPIVGGGGTWNLWVLHDPNYKPVNFGPAGTDAAADSSSTGIGSISRAARDAQSARQSSFDERSEPRSDKRPGRINKLIRLVIGYADRIESLIMRN
jgi:hypothetical protein